MFYIYILFFQITPGSKAAVANLCAGDVILAIEGVQATDLLHCEAQNKIKESTRQLSLTIERSEEATQSMLTNRWWRHLHSVLEYNTLAYIPIIHADTVQLWFPMVCL